MKGLVPYFLSIPPCWIDASHFLLNRIVTSDMQTTSIVRVSNGADCGDLTDSFDQFFPSLIWKYVSKKIQTFEIGIFLDCNANIAVSTSHQLLHSRLSISSAGLLTIKFAIALMHDDLSSLLRSDTIFMFLLPSRMDDIIISLSFPNPKLACFYQQLFKARVPFDCYGKGFHSIHIIRLMPFQNYFFRW